MAAANLAVDYVRRSLPPYRSAITARRPKPATSAANSRFSSIEAEHLQRAWIPLRGLSPLAGRRTPRLSGPLYSCWSPMRMNPIGGCS